MKDAGFEDINKVIDKCPPGTLSYKNLMQIMSLRLKSELLRVDRFWSMPRQGIRSGMYEISITGVILKKAIAIREILRSRIKKEYKKIEKLVRVPYRMDARHLMGGSGNYHRQDIQC